MKRKTKGTGAKPQPVKSAGITPNEKSLYARIRSLILSARASVARGVDLIQVRTNFEIGRHIVDNEQLGHKRAAYGLEVLNRLSEKLEAEFGKGFSRSNLEYMRRFYLTYASKEMISQTPSGKLIQPLTSQNPQTASGKSTFEIASRPFSLSWSHYVFHRKVQEWVDEVGK